MGILGNNTCILADAFLELPCSEDYNLLTVDVQNPCCDSGSRLFGCWKETTVKTSGDDHPVAHRHFVVTTVFLRWSPLQHV